MNAIAGQTLIKCERCGFSFLVFEELEISTAAWLCIPCDNHVRDLRALDEHVERANLAEWFHRDDLDPETAVRTMQAQIMAKEVDRLYMGEDADE